MAEALEFVDELPIGGADRIQIERAQQLIDHPGKWAIWPSSSGASGVLKTLQRLELRDETPDECWETCTRRVDNRYKTFARWKVEEPQAKAHDRDAASPPAAEAPDPSRPRAQCPRCNKRMSVPVGKTSTKVIAEHQAKECER